MSMAQMNTRIDAEVKERGDAVLAQAGYSSSQAVRAIWSFAASHAHEPLVVRQFLQQAEGGGQDPSAKAAADAKLEALEQALSLHERLETTLGFQLEAEEALTDRQLRGEALLSRWEDRGLL